MKANNIRQFKRIVSVLLVTIIVSNLSPKIVRGGQPTFSKRITDGKLYIDYDRGSGGSGMTPISSQVYLDGEELISFSSGFIVVEKAGTYEFWVTYSVFPVGSEDPYTYRSIVIIITEDDFPNIDPTLTVTNTDQTVKDNQTVSITGTVQDLDNDNLTVSAKIGNVTDTQTINNT